MHFLLRSEYETVSRQGLRLSSAVHGELALHPVNAYRDAAAMPPCDWLLVGAKTTSNAELAPLISQIAAPGARVVLLQNGLGVEEALRPLLPAHLNLLGGLCYICVHREAPGHVVHQSLGAVNLGYHSGPATDAAERMALLEEGWPSSGLPDWTPPPCPALNRRAGRSWCGTFPTTAFPLCSMRALPR